MPWAEHSQIALVLRRRVARSSYKLWRIASWLALLSALALTLRHATDVGVTWDEVFHLRYGDKVLAWFRSHFNDKSAMRYRNLYLYGGLFDVLAQWCVEHSTLGPYETRHVVTSLVALAGVVGCWKLAALVSGSRAGLLAALTLALTPAWLGHGMFNPKDIPFGSAAIWATYAAVRLGVGPMPMRAGAVFGAGLCLGIALAVRPGGVILIGYPLLAAGARLLLELRRRQRLPGGLKRKRALRLTAGVLFALLPALALAWTLMLSTWPWAQLDPLKRPFEALHSALNFHWNGVVLFRGERILAHDLPRSYLPVWFAVTLPEIYLVALACALFGLWRCAQRPVPMRGERVIGIAMIAVAAFLPLVMVWALKPVVYDGQRHLLFILPPLAAAAGVALDGVFRSFELPSRWRRATAAAWVALAMLTCVDIYKLHPYEYIYFNRLSGGLRGAYGRYETDYWGASYREGFAWVVNRMAPLDLGRRVRVSSCNVNTNERMAYYLDRWPGAKERFTIVKDYKRADLYLAITRDHCHEVPGEVLHQVRRQRVPLLFIIRTQKS